MDIDIHQSRINRQRQHCYRIAAMRHGFGIGTANGRQDQLVLHRTAIDEGILMGGIATVEGRHTGKAAQMHVLSLGIERNGIIPEIGAEHLGNSGKMIVAGRR